jgi:hypothetical protein
MHLEKLKKSTEWFRVTEVRSLEDPSGQVARKELVVSLDQYPENFSLGPNPREPVLTSPVSKKIAETLKDNGGNFHLLNRGITIVAKSMEFDNKTNKVRLSLAETEDEDRFYGILDGGNTNARINKWREELPDQDAAEELKKRFVNVQILIPMVGDAPPTQQMTMLLNDIKEARNTSVQVKSKSLADARRQFDLLKDTLKQQPYFPDISWHEGEKGTLDALQLVTFLMMYYPTFCQEADGEEPSNAYGHKERCLTAFLEYVEKEPEELEKWIRILPDIVRLLDTMQVTLPDFYEGSFGRIKEVKIYDEKRCERGSKKYSKTPSTSTYFGKEMRYSYPTGWLFPLFAAFRVLTGPDKGGNGIVWKRDPIDFWKRHGAEICKRFEPHMKEAGYEVKKIATNLICYQAMRQTVVELYKDELLREAGVVA